MAHLKHHAWKIPCDTSDILQVELYCVKSLRDSSSKATDVPMTKVVAMHSKVHPPSHTPPARNDRRCRHSPIYVYRSLHLALTRQSVLPPLELSRQPVLPPIAHTRLSALPPSSTHAPVCAATTHLLRSTTLRDALGLHTMCAQSS
eukprot:685275-Pleurochrysis_carterae.AAC.1